MRKIKYPKIGEYVLVTRWSDRDPYDPWYVSYIESITIYDGGVSYRVKGSNRNWGNCHRITPEEGVAWLKLYGDNITN